MLTAVSLLLLGAYDVPVQPPPGELPSLDWNQAVFCVQLQPTKKVPSGAYRMQCNPQYRQCLASPNTILVDGVESTEPLSRTHFGCGAVLDDVSRKAMEEQWPVFEAVAETPAGWYRDDRGRVVQVNFDMGRRVYLGGSWAPYYRPDGTGSLGRVKVEFSANVHLIPENSNVQHRMRFLDTNVWLGASPRDIRFEGSVFRYEWGARLTHSPLWATTFFGQPRRTDIPLNFGFGLEVARIEYLNGATFVSIAEFDGAVDIWRSNDLESFIRLRLGPAAEYDVVARGVGLRPTVAVDADFTFDENGFHHLIANASAEKLYFTPRVEGRSLHPSRLRFKLAYEVILFSINDYPLTLVVDGRGTWRDDVVGMTGWEFSANAGLRFSLWAPARYSSRQLRVASEPLPAPSVKSE